jgi:hypothetical protein
MKHLSTYQIFEANVTDDPIEIITKLNKDKKVKYTLNKDNSIDVEGNVDLSYLSLTEMPVKFGKVTGNFYCDNNKLTSLEHAPITVSGDFRCSYNQLTTLEGSPTTVTGNFRCFDNKLTSLKGCPTTVSGDFDCFDNKLTSLEHGPITVNGDFYCYRNNLTSLEHGPKTVSGWFSCSNNKFPEDIQKKIDNFKGTWQELMVLNVIWQSKKLNDLNNKTGLFN